jgi:hypothetical protein
MFLCCVYRGTFREQTKVYSRCRWGIIYVSAVRTGARTELCGTLAATFLGKESSLSAETLKFLLVKKEAISLMRLIENYSSDSLNIIGRGAMLCQRLFRCPRIQHRSTYCYWNSETRDPLASYIGVSCCDVHGSQTDLRLASFFLKKFARSEQEANRT